tara:strand:- start:31 stop:477 length:447 start_codon:yes stop_codon:yes gene_type:complete
VVIVARSKLPKWAIKKAGGINKKAWRLFRRGRNKASPKRKNRANNPKRRNMARRRMAIPHPSVTGMAAGFSILDDLSGGNGASVIDTALQGNLGKAVTDLGANAQRLVKTQTGRTALVQAVGIAAIGAFARKTFPDTKLGGTKFYFRI